MRDEIRELALKIGLDVLRQELLGQWDSEQQEARAAAVLGRAAKSGMEKAREAGVIDDAIQTTTMTCPEAPGPVAPTPTSGKTRLPTAAPEPDAQPGRTPRRKDRDRSHKKCGRGVYERKVCCIDKCTHVGWRRGKTGLVCASHYAEEQGMIKQIEEIDGKIQRGA
jgi:hypothetical protein